MPRSAIELGRLVILLGLLVADDQGLLVEEAAALLAGERRAGRFGGVDQPHGLGRALAVVIGAAGAVVGGDDRELQGFIAERAAVIGFG